MSLKDMTVEDAYTNYKKNGMRILADNGVVRGIIRDW